MNRKTVLSYIKGFIDNCGAFAKAFRNLGEISGEILVVLVKIGSFKGCLFKLYGRNLVELSLLTKYLFQFKYKKF